MMNITYVLLLVSLSQSATELYNKGNASYTQSDFHEAIGSYEEALHHITSAPVYYNLGNAYFKSGRIGKAIINYRRARFLAPRDPDINHNLDFARNYRVDKTRSSNSPISTLLSAAFQSLSLREAQITATILFVILSITLSLYIIKRKAVFGYAALVVGILFIFSFISWQVWVAEKNARNAVITIPEINALSGPGDEYKHILVLHDGAEVRIREERQNYVLIQLPGGLGGWVDKESLEEVH
jgi:tetratricopeptide (TPR) repeat protein